MAYTVGMISLGCAKNRVDAEMLMHSLHIGGYKLKNDPAMCDIAIINTCGFIESAKQESIDEILELCQLKKEGKIKAIVVTGCLAERYQKQITEEIPEVDAVLGIGANRDICSLLDEVMKGKQVTSFPDKVCLPLEGGRVQSTEFHWAYIKIAEGCDNCCTYCAIPSIRGRFRSRKIEDIVKEAERLASNGVKELNIVAQDTSRYGEDNYRKRMLPSLLTELCKIDGIEWIRVLYCYPERITDELIDVMAKEDKIIKYIDLPLQHCNKDVLKRMNRRGDRESLTSLINKIRDRIPNVVLRTTLIAGFPGETDEQFEELSEFIKDMKFERLGCFPYSQEEDTPAAEFKDQIDEDVKQHRAEIISEQEAVIMHEFALSKVGTAVDVLVDGFDRYADSYFGRSPYDAPEVDPVVFFTKKDRIPSQGEIVKVLITDTLDCDLVGEML